MHSFVVWFARAVFGSFFIISIIGLVLSFAGFWDVLLFDRNKEQLYNSSGELTWTSEYFLPFVSIPTTVDNYNGIIGVKSYVNEINVDPTFYRENGTIIEDIEFVELSNIDEEGVITWWNIDLDEEYSLELHLPLVTSSSFDNWNPNSTIAIKWTVTLYKTNTGSIIIPRASFGGAFLVIILSIILFEYIRRRRAEDELYSNKVRFF